MKYEFVPYREQVSNDDLLLDLKRVASILGKRSITQKEYIEYGKYGIEKVLYRFGNWNSALEQANLHLSANHQHSIEDLFENIESVWQIKGKQPSRADMNNKAISRISSGAYLRRFGTWSNALKTFVEYMSQDDVDLSLEDTLVICSKKEARGVNLRLRWRVLQRDNYKCCKCGASPATDSSVQLQVDHIIPWSKGGKTSIDNLQTLCRNCNLGKGDLI